MHLSLEEVCQMEVLQSAHLQGNNGWYENKIIEWVSVIETPVENFVRKNEFVLSTGIGCGHEEELFLQFVEDIIEAGASVLAIAVGRHIQEIPPSVLELAKEHNFPIIQLPWEIRFADVIQGILEEMNKRKERLTEKSEEIQKKFLHIILHGGGLTEIANFMYKTFHCPVLITDKRGQIKCCSKQANRFIEQWNEYLHTEEYAASLLTFEKNQFLNSSNIRHIFIEDYKITQLTIQTSSDIQGYLLIGLKRNEKEKAMKDEATMQLLEHAAMAVALCFLRENTIQETEMRLRDDFVWSLAKGTVQSWEQILSRAKSLGYYVSLPYACIIGYPENLKTMYKKNKTEKYSYEDWYETMVRRIEDEIFYTTRTIHCHTLTTFQRDQFIIFLEVKESVDQSVSSFIELMINRMNRLLPNLIMSWGIGKTAGIKCFHESYNEAQTAIEMGRRQKGPGHKSTYADTRIDRALMSLVNNEELKKITDSTIRKLIKYDEERGIDLINTYLTYSSNGGNVSQTSRDLSLHRQSLLYRLRKIESLTDCKLENPDDVLLLDLSIKLWTVGLLDKK